ncbi:MAG: hypothetical protein A3J73_05615 [Planctomycetes bacterium RIFCSPHIGHO2_02_FULL_38_41]|nr:MAG: hypothetical protein A3J73_05615 [Planctomycetes bacterium RIFCSPHIGHO2_02_FULL_38_41]OHB97485.1 MAG: hypothetical protein A2W74_09720 [Planctomycetes bacterium RIFCSPLOWO2_12_38_17]
MIKKDTNIPYSQNRDSQTVVSRLVYIILVILPLCAFLNTLFNGFVYDDISVLEENYFIRNLGNIPKVFSKEYFRLANELSYRPVVTLSYFIDYAIWRYNPFGYHLSNVILHAANCVLLYLLLVQLTKVRLAALFSAVIFSIHPCTTEAVNCLSYREDIFVATFSFLACLCLIKSVRIYHYSCKTSTSYHVKTKNRQADGQCSQTFASRYWMWIYYAGSLLFYLLSLLSKESAIVVPLFILLYWFLFRRKSGPSLHLNQSENKNSVIHSLSEDNEHSSHTKLRWIKYFVSYYLGYILVSIFYLCIRFLVLKNPLEISASYVKGSIPINFMTMSKVLSSYIKLMFLPTHLSADYTIAEVLSAFDVSFVISIILLTAVGVIIFKTVNKTKTYSLFMLYFFVSLLPVLNIVPIGHIMADRYLYLPVAMFCPVIGGLLFYNRPSRLSVDIQRKLPVYSYYSVLTRNYIVIPVVSIICITFFVRTMLRNMVWRSEFVFWTKILKEQPGNWDAHNNLGRYLFNQGRLDAAIDELEMAVKLKENFPEGHNSLGTMYIEKGLIDKAIIEYRKALKYMPVFPHAYYNLGNACVKKGLIDDGIAFFNKAISQGMYAPQVFNNLGSAYLKKGMMDEAIVQYQKALLVSKDFAEPHSNIGYVYTEKGELDKAMTELEEAIRLQPDHSNAHNNLGVVYCQKGLWDAALNEFQKSVMFDTKNASAHKNLGMFYFAKGDKLLAREHLIQMLKHDPNYLKGHGVFEAALELGLMKKQ